MKQCLDNVTSILRQRKNDVMQHWKTIGLTFSNLDSTLFQGQTLPLYQRCTKLKIGRQILFHFQCRIKSSSPFPLHTLLEKGRETNKERQSTGMGVGSKDSIEYLLGYIYCLVFVYLIAFTSSHLRN